MLQSVEIKFYLNSLLSSNTHNCRQEGFLRGWTNETSYKVDIYFADTKTNKNRKKTIFKIKKQSEFIVLTFINDYYAFVEMVDVVSIFQTDEQRLEWRVYEQSKKKDSKAIFIFIFLENKYFYIKTKEIHF